MSEKKRLSIVFLKRVTKIRSRRRECTEQRAATIFSEGPRGHILLFTISYFGVCAQSVAGDADSAHGSGSWVSEKKRLIIVFSSEVPKARSCRSEFCERRATTMRRDWDVRVARY